MGIIYRAPTTKPKSSEAVNSHWLWMHNQCMQIQWSPFSTNSSRPDEMALTKKSNSCYQYKDI